MYWPSGAFRLITPSRSRNAALLMKEFLFHQLGNNVADQGMALLNARRVARWSAKAVIYIGSLFEFAPWRAGKCNGMQTNFFGRRNTMDYVWRTTAGGKPDGDVSGTCQSFELARENLVEAIVVSNRRNARGVHRKSQSRQRRAIKCKTADEFSGDVLRVGSASTVPKKEQLVSTL